MNSRTPFVALREKTTRTATLLAVLASFCITSHALELITTTEAKLPNQASALIPKGIVRGPGLQIISPDLGSPVSTAFDLKIKFEPRGGVRVDPDSVKITYLKDPVIDLTDRIKSNISDSGVVVNAAQVPPGDHILRVSVRDVSGRESAVVLSVNVKNK